MSEQKLMPLYTCHKQVRALKIKRTYTTGNTNWPWKIEFEDAGYPDREVTSEWMYKNMPQPGWYLVEYKDGYLSASPASAFEEGYTLVPESPSDVEHVSV